MSGIFWLYIEDFQELCLYHAFIGSFFAWDGDLIFERTSLS